MERTTNVMSFVRFASIRAHSGLMRTQRPGDSRPAMRYRLMSAYATTTTPMAMTTLTTILLRRVYALERHSST